MNNTPVSASVALHAPITIPVEIALCALAVCASVIFQNVLFLETSSLVTMYELSSAVELYSSLCLLYFSLLFFLAKRQAQKQDSKRKKRVLFALVFSPAILYATAVMAGLPFNMVSLSTSILSFASWLISLASIVAALSTRQNIPLSGIQTQNPVFSKRENEVAALILHGLTTQETADALFISVATVKTHLQHIYEKAGVRNRAELARVLSEQKAT